MRALTFLLSTILVVSCGFLNRSTKVTIEGGTQPVFVLSGSGYFSSLIVIDTSLQTDPKRKTWIWQIEVDGPPENAKTLEEVKSIKYGEIPSGYRQELPAAGVPPPALTGGKDYLYILGTMNASIATGGFQIKNGKAISLGQK